MPVEPKIRVSISTNSLGKAAGGHHIHRKLEAARKHGFEGVEVAFECLESHATLVPFVNEKLRSDRLRAAAQDIYTKATAESLEIIALTPFGAYDSLDEPEAIETRLQEAELWLQICKIFRAPIFQIPSFAQPSDKPLTSDVNKIARNLRRLGLLAQRYDITVAYEAVAWGTYVNTWQQMRDIVHLVNLPNVRYCIDTFHIAAKVAGDPFNRLTPVRPGGMADLRKSLDELRQTLKASDIGYLQLSDAIVADSEQKGYPNQDLSQPPFMTQSRNCRIFPCETEYGGILPALDVAKAVFDVGYRGWVSMEVFHTDLFKEDDRIPNEWARRGRASWKKVSSECSLETPARL